MWQALETDKKIGEAVRRHRACGERFAYRDIDELYAIEAERLRVEKEDRLIEVAEIRFYDFDARRGHRATKRATLYR